MRGLLKRAVWAGANKVAPGILDPAPIVAGLAFAVGYQRLLSMWPGPIIRVQRTVPDSTQLDIPGLDSGLLNETILANFATTGDAYAVLRYDQTGNGRHIAQSGGPVGSAPRIVTAGTIERLNGHPCGKIITGDSEFETTANFVAPYTGTLLAAVWAGRLASQAASDRMISVNLAGSQDWNAAGVGGLIMIGTGGTSPTIQTFSNNAIWADGATFTNGATLGASCRFDGTTETLRANASTVTKPFTAAWNFSRIVTGSQANSAERLSAGSFAGTQIMWFADPGAANVEAVRTAAAAFWGGS